MAEIMDVSRYQGTIDWEKVKASGKVDGVIIRAMGNSATGRPSAPYTDPQFSTVSRLFGLLKPTGLMVLSHPGRGEGPNLTNGIVVVDNRSYGNAYLTSFRRESTTPL